MAVQVPDEPKAYTTIYDNFKGVDFTNDSSNLYKRRSPMGKNMLPDLDGKPYKRAGWEIAITADEFREAAGVKDVEVVPDKVYYFEIGGYDYLLIFNNLGIFSYTPNPIERSAEHFPYIIKHCNTYIDLDNKEQAFPPKIDGIDVPIDSGRAFFFEGGGTAGFYLFVGLKLFRYDGAYFAEVDPYIPLTLIGCDSNGAGTTLESVNMLTSKRIVQYTCDGETKAFTIPGGVKGTPSVEVIDPNTGSWKAATGYTISNGRIDFTTAPAEVVKGEDNLRVTYEPDGMGAYAETSTKTLSAKVVSVKRVVTQRQRKWTQNGNAGDWTTIKTEYVRNGATFDVPNLSINESTKEKDISYEYMNSSGAWVKVPAANYSATFGSYNSKVTVTPTKAMFSSSMPKVNSASSQAAKTSTGSWKKTSTYRVAVNIGGGKTTKKKEYRYERTRTITEYHEYKIRTSYTSYVYNGGDKSENTSVTAFTQCSRALVFGSGIINQVFMSTTPYESYNTRIWYSAATNPTYFPDTNYIEVGATDTPIMGLMKVGEYLGVIKQGTSFDTSIYLAYPTSFDDDTTYAVKQNINGIGAVSNGAFNTLNEEPLFLSKAGVMGIEVSTEDTDRQLRNRSFYINKKLCAEPNLNSAVSFVYNGMYYLAVNNKCYVLDGSQKNSWANTKTNLQYECYYLENVPAQCFARFQDQLWFSDFKGNMCRFKDENSAHTYRDDYSVEEPDFILESEPIDLVVNGEGFFIGQILRYDDKWYTVTDIEDETAHLAEGVPIEAVWATIADDDGAVHYFKNLQKKGCVISLLPSSDSGVKVYVKADSNEPYLVGETDAKDFELPFDFYLKKKIKKYKRLQFICENGVIDDSFGIDQIVKTYTVGNYSKNRG